jgi:putative transposase
MLPPRVMITDKLASYGAAKREPCTASSIGSTRDRITGGENSHHPTRRRERQMKQFKSAG